MKQLLWTGVAVVLGTGLQAACPAPDDITREMQRLFEQAQSAENLTEGRGISAKMWQVWLRAPDDTAQEILDAGMRRRDVYDFAGAKAAFDRLAAYCPDYAEGFNQRAYIHYLQGNYEEALVDLDIALGLQPDHVAAQSGRGLTLMQLGRIAQARAQMLIAVGNNPWLSEAALLAKGAPLGPIGEDI